MSLMIQICLGKRHYPCKEAYTLLIGEYMKRTTAFLAIVLLIGSGLFAATQTGPAKIKVSSVVTDFTVFGVSLFPLLPTDYTSLVNYSNAASSSIDSSVTMVELDGEVTVGYLSAINNTKKTIMLYVATTALTTGDGPNDSRVGLHVRPNNYKIPPAKDSKYGILESSPLRIIETTKGAAKRAPAGTYTAIIRVTLEFGG